MTTPTQQPPLNELFKVGDVIQLNGPTVPMDLRDKYFRVEAVGDEIRLSNPYHDAELKRLYHPAWPKELRRW